MPELTKFQKITVGFVIQRFEKKNGQFVCTHQNFVAGDQCDYEYMDGNTLVEVPEYDYQPYNMTVD